MYSMIVIAGKGGIIILLQAVLELSLLHRDVEHDSIRRVEYITSSWSITIRRVCLTCWSPSSKLSPLSGATVSHCIQ